MQSTFSISNAKQTNKFWIIDCILFIYIYIYIFYFSYNSKFDYVNSKKNYTPNCIDISYLIVL